MFYLTGALNLPIHKSPKICFILKSQVMLMCRFQSTSSSRTFCCGTHQHDESQSPGHHPMHLAREVTAGLEDLHCKAVRRYGQQPTQKSVVASEGGQQLHCRCCVMHKYVPETKGPHLEFLIHKNLKRGYWICPMETFGRVIIKMQ